MSVADRRAGPGARRGPAAGREGAAAPLDITFEVNGRPVAIKAPPFRRLLDVLREDLRLTGAKEGCGEGECGACSIIMNGAIVNSCLVPVIQAQGARITTVEAMRDTPLGAAIQKAFCEHGGSQCGICTPGMIVTATWLVQNRATLPEGAFRPSEGDGGPAAGDDARPKVPDLRQLMAGNLCRCTGYDLIIESVEAALAELLAAETGADERGTNKDGRS